jgi:hypothetical protein
MEWSNERTECGLFSLVETQLNEADFDPDPPPGLNRIVSLHYLSGICLAALPGAGSSPRQFSSRESPSAYFAGALITGGPLPAHPILSIR